MHPPDSLSSRIQSWLREWGVFALLLFIFFLSDIGDAVPGWIGIAVLFGYIAIQNMMEYPVTTIGTKQSVEAEPLDTDNVVRCDTCGSPIREARGERRMYAEQQIAFGVPVRTLDWGENVYCLACESPMTEEGRDPIHFLCI